MITTIRLVNISLREDQGKEESKVQFCILLSCLQWHFQRLAASLDQIIYFLSVTLLHILCSL